MVGNIGELVDGRFKRMILCLFRFRLGCIVRGSVCFKDAASELFSRRVQEGTVVPVGQNKSLTNDLSDPAFNGTKNDTIGNLPATHNGLNAHLDVWHSLKGNPESVARRRFDPD